MTSSTYEISRAWRDRGHATRKAFSTIRILFNLGMARTFGHYRHSVWNGQFDYAVYEWRGKEWAIPTTPITGDQ